MAQTNHVVRSWCHLFEAMVSGEKTHDLRRNDRHYQVGDTLDLQEYDIRFGRPTGRSLRMQITYITGRDEGHHPCAVSSAVLDPEYVILSVRKFP